MSPEVAKQACVFGRGRGGGVIKSRKGLLLDCERSRVLSRSFRSFSLRWSASVLSHLIGDCRPRYWSPCMPCIGIAFLDYFQK